MYFTCNLQAAAEGPRRAVSSFKGSAFPGDGKNTGSGSIGGHAPLFSGIRVMGTGDLTLSEQCPWSVVITSQASWQGKEQPRLTKPLLTSAT